MKSPKKNRRFPKNYFDNNIITIEIEPIENEQEHEEDISNYFLLNRKR